MVDPVRTGSDRLADGAPWPLPIRLPLSGVASAERGGVAGAGLPAKPGVIAVVSFDGEAPRPVLVSATGDLRGFALRRLSGGGPSTDLSPVADALLACPLGSGFEADWAQGVLSAAWTPDAHAGTVAQRKPWFLTLDAEASEPVWRVVDEPGGGEARAHTIGPFMSKARATAFGRALDDRFELCREPRLLAQRPGATACAYKEMGRCPAACDGSEPMSAYRGRVRDGLGFVRSGVSAVRVDLERRMEVAAREMDFETAGRLRDELDGLAAFGARSAGWATTLDRFGVLAVVPSGRKRWARLIACSGDGASYLADVNSDEAADRAAENLESALSGLLGGPEALSRVQGGGRCEPMPDFMGVLCVRLFSKRKTRSSYLRLDPRPSVDEVVSAVERAARVETDEPGEFAEPVADSDTSGRPAGGA